MEREPRKKRIGLVVTIILLLLVAIVVLSINITTITVTGNQRYSEQQITDLLFPDQTSRNTVFCMVKDRFKPHAKIPFVEDYKLVYHGPTNVEVIIYEKSVVGYVSYMSSYMYFDKDGIVVESANRGLSGIPLITGLKFGQIVLYQPLPVTDHEVFGEILNLTQVLSLYSMEVDRIQYNAAHEATLYMKHVEVVLGSNSSLNGKIAELHDMLPQLEGLDGTLYLDSFDENNTSAMYTFKPRRS